MRIMADARAFNHLIDNHNLVLSRYTIDEIKDVIIERPKIMKPREYIDKYIG